MENDKTTRDKLLENLFNNKSRTGKSIKIVSSSEKKKVESHNRLESQAPTNVFFFNFPRNEYEWL